MLSILWPHHAHIIMVEATQIDEAVQLPAGVGTRFQRADDWSQALISSCLRYEALKDRRLSQFIYHCKHGFLDGWFSILYWECSMLIISTHSRTAAPLPTNLKCRYAYEITLCKCIIKNFTKCSFKSAWCTLATLL